MRCRARMLRLDSDVTSRDVGVIIVLINALFALSRAFYTSLAIHRACVAKLARRRRRAASRSP